MEKAVWMLQVDALDALRDCLQLNGEKRHRLVGRLFRDILENLNLAAYFDSGKETAATDLDSWYDNEIVPHSRYRDYLEKNEGHDKAAKSRASYRRLSKVTHRTYRSLAQGYVLASEIRIVYEGVSESGLLIPPHTISQYYAVVAQLIMVLAVHLSAHGRVAEDQVRAAWAAAMEPNPVPRRFVPQLKL